MNQDISFKVWENYYKCVEKIVPVEATQDILVGELAKHKISYRMFGSDQPIRAKDTRPPGK